MTSTQKAYFRILRSGKIKHYRFNFHDMKLRKTLKLNIAKSYVISNYIYFDSIEKTLAFLESSTPIDSKTLDNLYLEMIVKLSKKLVRKTSNITFKRKIDWNTYKSLINDNNAIVIEKPFNSGNFYRLIQPTYAIACLDIVNNHFQDSVFDDITQEIAQDLWKMYLNNQCKVVYNFITKDSEPIFVFDTYTQENGTEKSYYWKLFSTIERVLTNYSNHSKAQKKGYAITNIDAYEKAINPFLQDDNSKLTTQNINAYMRAIAKYNKFDNDTVLKRQDIQEFFKKCENDFSRKHIDKLKFVLDCTFNSMTIKQTHNFAKQNDISLSESAIGKMRLELRELWAKYQMKVDIFEFDTDSFITYYKPLECYGSNNKKHKYAKLNKLTTYKNAQSIINNVNFDSTLIIKESYDSLAIKKACKSGKLVNQNSDYSKYVQAYQDSNELAFINAINDYCTSIDSTLQTEPQFTYSYYLNKLVKNPKYEFIALNKSNLHIVKRDNGIYTYYDNSLVRFIPYKIKK